MFDVCLTMGNYIARRGEGGGKESEWSVSGRGVGCR